MFCLTDCRPSSTPDGGHTQITESRWTAIAEIGTDYDVGDANGEPVIRPLWTAEPANPIMNFSTVPIG